LVKKLLLFILLLEPVTGIFAQADTTGVYGYRDIILGMSLDSLRAVCKLKPLKPDTAQPCVQSYKATGKRYNQLYDCKLRMLTVNVYRGKVIGIGITADGDNRNRLLGALTRLYGPPQPTKGITGAGRLIVPQYWPGKTLCNYVNLGELSAFTLFSRASVQEIFDCKNERNKK
jgi:hypothetical protein